MKKAFLGIMLFAAGFQGLRTGNPLMAERYEDEFAQLVGLTGCAMLVSCGLVLLGKALLEFNRRR